MTKLPKQIRMTTLYYEKMLNSRFVLKVNDEDNFITNLVPFNGLTVVIDDTLNKDYELDY
jgi:hypothetical protein